MQDKKAFPQGRLLTTYLQMLEWQKWTQMAEMEMC